MAALDRPTVARPIDRELGPLVAYGVSALTAIAGAALCARRLDGAFLRPVGVDSLACVGLSLLLAEELSSRLLRRDGRDARQREPGASAAARIAFSFGAALCCAGLSSVASGGALVVLWAPAALAIGLTVRRGGGLRREFVPAVDTSAPVSAPNASAHCAVDSSSTRGALGELGLASLPEEVAGLQGGADEPEIDAEIIQQFTRRADADGVERLSGLARVRFDVGQRTGHAHVGFCPPFLTTPSCQAEPVAGAEAEVRVSRLLPHGARLDARLEAAAEAATDVLIEFLVEWRPRTGADEA